MSTARKFNIVSMALAAQAFCHWKHPATGKKMYLQAVDSEGREQFHADGTPVDDLTKPIGVKLYGPGSHVYQAATSKITTENIKLGKKGLTGDLLKENAAQLLAETTAEFVNFEYEGLPENAATYLAFYSDPRMVDFKEQSEETQGDAGNFLPKR